MVRNEQGGKVDGWFCVCLECSARTPRLKIVTCLETSCPKCGAVTVREGSPYHKYAMRRRLATDLRAALARRGVEMKPQKDSVPAGSAEAQKGVGEFSFS